VSARLHGSRRSARTRRTSLGHGFVAQSPSRLLTRAGFEQLDWRNVHAVIIKGVVAAQPG
jgi:hypothetical protein